MLLTHLPELIERGWPGKVRISLDPSPPRCRVECDPAALADLCHWLFAQLDYSFASLIVEEAASEWVLRYVFYGDRDAGQVCVLARQALAERQARSITPGVPAADWHEREVEDLFGLIFTGHPILGEFVLHEEWPEGVNPMRRDFNARQPFPHREPDPQWRPRRIVHAPGAFSMPVGPIYSGVTESVHFVLETVGEDVIRAFPRLFYKYRGVEKLAERRSVDDALLLAERCNGTSAFAHALAFCQAVEAVCEAEVPPRAWALRLLLAELERLRHHVGAIREICESTALAVATSQAALLEEELLRLSGALTGHRYLFGLAVPGGLTRDLQDGDCREAVERTQDIGRRLSELEERLRFSSSFLDRLEGMGIVARQEASAHGLVGPVARASGVVRDLRKAQPYSGYDALEFDVPSEPEGDGYARLRVLFAEAGQAVRLMGQAVAALPRGPVRGLVEIQPGVALGWVEAPRGAAFHWLRLGDDASVSRYRLTTPSFTNWHGFYLAAENFAFQDFPIILATFGLSVAESDR